MGLEVTYSRTAVVPVFCLSGAFGRLFVRNGKAQSPFIGGRGGLAVVSQRGVCVPFTLRFASASGVGCGTAFVVGILSGSVSQVLCLGD